MLGLLSVIGLAATCLLAVPSASAATGIDLSRNFRTRFTGAGDVAGAGDVTGDGSIDVVVTEASADPLGRTKLEDPVYRCCPYRAPVESPGGLRRWRV